MISAYAIPMPPTFRRLRVAIVAPSLNYVGGQAVQADLLLRYWKDDPDVDAYFVPVDPLPPKLLRWAQKVPFFRTALREPVYLRNLFRELKHSDVVHAFSASYSSFLLAPVPALLIGQRFGKKVIINYHSGEAGDHMSRSARAVHLLAMADARVVPSGYLKKVFAEFRLTADVVPNLIDMSQFQFRTRVPLRPKLICSRGFHPYYRVDLVLRSFRVVKDAFPTATLCLLGAGPEEQRLRSLTHELGLSDVEFAGAVSRQQIGRHYDNADIFINASYVDNMPVSILEAFGAGTPVVTTAPEGIRYVVEHERTGMLCDPGDWEALGTSVIRLLNDAVLAQRLVANGLLESKRYLWEAIRPEWLKVYGSLCAQVPARP